MDSIGRGVSPATPLKDSQAPRCKNHSENSKYSENSNPNLSNSSSKPKQTNSPVIKSVKSQKSASKHSKPAALVSPRNRIRERKFVVAKKNGKKGDQNGDSKVACKCNEKGSGGNSKKCLCVAYENLRASQEEFFKNRSGGGEETCESKEENEEIEKGLTIHDLEAADGFHGEVGGNESNDLNDPEFCEVGEIDQMGTSTVKRRRDRLMEDARNSVPETGAGRVMHLVKAFEKLLTIPKETVQTNDGNETEGESVNVKKEPVKWALPGLQPPKAPETELSASSFSPLELMLTAENLGLDLRASLSSSWDSTQGSISSRTSNGGRRSRRNSTESCATTHGGSRWKKKQLKATCQKPFKLKTEQRGRLKEEEFTKKMQDMMEEQERLRIPIAQGLPWTTDEPECLIKPPVKENTRPLDLKLHSDLRAMERAEFDQQMAEKMSLIEQYKMERERQQKLEEEEEIRRLRKELVPKAQPMPYFDRPFVPRRSSRNPTMPREPKFHIPQHKKIKCALSWNDISPYTYHQ
ncbi:hypothetical protein CDL15_Pgr020504 [Punica granatum]|uniref:TPX2 C-terminal domain-containing protein n=1 Tax=Punica granatum TaxID=22663 RepID=A0A218VVG7_PUNGR|nr:hypothetical protein CDL15_Pgr020504 [Punica granatum]